MSQDNTKPQALQATTGLYGKTPQGASHLDGSWNQAYAGSLTWGDQRYRVTVNGKCTQVAINNLGTWDIHIAKIKVWTFENWGTKRTASVWWLTIFINDTKAEYYKESQLNKYYAKVQWAAKSITFGIEEQEEIDPNAAPDF